MGKKITCELKCDVCESVETLDHDVDQLPDKWDYATITVGHFKSSKFVICPECRGNVYEARFFSKIFNAIKAKLKK